VFCGLLSLRLFDIGRAGSGCHPI